MVSVAEKNLNPKRLKVVLRDSLHCPGGPDRHEDRGLYHAVGCVEQPRASARGRVAMGHGEEQVVSGVSGKWLVSMVSDQYSGDSWSLQFPLRLRPPRRANHGAIGHR
jgi:hypothetical protein